jgi:glutaminase
LIDASTGSTNLLDHINDMVQSEFGKGKVADYIPALARVPANQFAMALYAVDGTVLTTGDANRAFSIQSLSKLFALQLLISQTGDSVWTRVGKEPSGGVFNSQIILEQDQGVPRNPFLNAGAIVVADMLKSHGRHQPDRLLKYLRGLSGNASLEINREVLESELAHADINRGLANLMKAHGRIDGDIETLLEIYCGQCAIEMSCVDLARAALPLANSGRIAASEESVITESQAKRINAVMLTCGMYDAVGSFAYRVGLPAKSGVGGGIVAVAPGKYAVAVWAPELDRSGNSYVGTAALAYLTEMTGTSIFL